MKIFEETFRSDTTATKWRFYPIGDTHLGASDCDEQELAHTIKRVKEDPFARVILMGDIADYISRSDKRFESGGLSDWIPTSAISTIGKVQVDYAIEMFSPIKDQIIVALHGNHEGTFVKHYGFDVHEMFCNALGVRNGQYSSFFRMNFIRETKDGKPSTHRVWDIFAHHGYGAARTKGAKVKAISEFASAFSARVYLMGHVHTMGWCPQDARLFLSRHKGQLKYREEIQHFALTGTYKKSYSTDHSSYSEVKAYRPTVIGSPWWEYTPEADEFEERTMTRKTTLEVAGD